MIEKKKKKKKEKETIIRTNEPVVMNDRYYILNDIKNRL